MMRKDFFPPFGGSHPCGAHQGAISDRDRNADGRGAFTELPTACRRPTAILIDAGRHAPWQLHIHGELK